MSTTCILPSMAENLVVTICPHTVLPFIRQSAHLPETAHGGVFTESYTVGRTCIASYPVHCVPFAENDLIGPRHQYDSVRSEYYTGHSVARTVYIYYFTIHGNGIETGKENIARKSAFSGLHAFFSGSSRKWVDKIVISPAFTASLRPISSMVTEYPHDTDAPSGIIDIISLRASSCFHSNIRRYFSFRDPLLLFRSSLCWLFLRFRPFFFSSFNLRLTASVVFICLYGLFVLKRGKKRGGSCHSLLCRTLYIHTARCG